MTEYNKKWFEDRALESLKRIDENTLDFSDSLLLYLPESEEAYEDMQDTNVSEYANIVTIPEDTYLKSISEQIVSKLPEKFEFVDLGPGTAGKEKCIFEAAKNQNKEIIYIPVDISKYYLEKAVESAKGFGYGILPVNSSFEELPEILKDKVLPRFVSLGLTYSNFDPQEILKLLSEIAGVDGYIFVNSQIRDKVDIEKLRKIYKEDVSAVGKPKLELLGLNPLVDIGKIEVDSGLKVWFTINNSNERLGIKSGDKLLMFQSLRPTKNSLIEELDTFGSKYELFDTGESFVGTLVYT